MTEKLHQSSTSEKADEDQESLSVTITDRLTRVLDKVGQALHLQDICLLVEEDGLGEINTSSAAGALREMTRRGLMVRISRGVYSLPQFANETCDHPRATFEERIEVILRSARQTLPVWEINLRMEEDGYGEPRAASARAALHEMTRSGEVVKTGRGFYCLPEFATQEYESPKKTLGQRIIVTLWQAARPVYLHELHRLTEIDNLGKINPESITSTLSPMVRKKLIVRTERGIYALPEFSYASEKKPNSYINKAEIISGVVNILSEAGGSASTSYIYLLLTAGNLRGLSLKHVSDMLKRLAQEDEINRRIVRTAKNTYCLSEIAAQEYEESPSKIKDKLLSILQAAGRPLHRYEMYQFAEEGEYGAIKLSSITSILTQLTKEGLTVRVVRGVYSMPEFADEHYELPKLTLSLRVYFALLEAGRPLHRTEVYRLVNIDSRDEISLQKIGSILVWMAQEKKTVRVETGIYSLPEFADGDYERPVRMTIDVRLIAVLKEAGQPLHRSEICRKAEEDGYGSIRLRSTKSTFTRMTREKITVWVAPGVYSMPEFADRDYELPKVAVSIRMITVLKEAGRPLHWQEAHQKAEEDGYGPIKPSSANSELARMTKEGTVIRVNQSIYSMPEFAGGDYKLPEVAANVRLIAALKEAGRPLHWQEAHQKAEEDGYGPIKPSSTRKVLAQMTEKGTVVRVKRGFYSLLEFAGK